MRGIDVLAGLHQSMVNPCQEIRGLPFRLRSGDKFAVAEYVDNGHNGAFELRRPLAALVWFLDRLFFSSIAVSDDEGVWFSPIGCG
jgi:hypothetical protein